MLGSILSTMVITGLIMFLLHHTYIHLQATLTVPKVSDLVRRPGKKYEEIETILQAAPMKKELSDFLSRLRH